MIKFVIVDDNIKFVNKLSNIVRRYMMKCDFEYEIAGFTQYNDDFVKITRDDSCFKIYFLDIETDESSGLDVVRYIREGLNDWISVLVIVTSHTEYKYEALGNRLFLLDFVSKLNDLENTIKDDLARALAIYSSKKRAVSFETKKEVTKIDYENIIMIKKLKASKQVLITSSVGEHKVTKNINEIIKELDIRFIQTSRSTIINKDYIETFDKTTNTITFTNGSTTSDISRRFKKEVVRRVTNNL